MPSWKQLNEQIALCRRSTDPLAKLEALFASTNDAHVAMALGEVHQAKGSRDQAIRWFCVAEQRYPRPEFKARARAARTVLEAPAEIGSTSDVLPSRSVLHVISCSRTKVWSTDGAKDRFVAAGKAYRGADMLEWLDAPESRTARWLVLSAKYGFIEPDHPVSDYDVTFKDASTGPIPYEALRAQVRGQVRWADKIRLDGFTDVVVHGGADYVAACRVAFGGVAMVRRAGSNEPEASQLIDRDPLVVDAGRAAALAAAFSQIPDVVYAALDKREPEWSILERLATGPSNGVLTALALALTDYQLGQGGAPAYWQEIDNLLAARGVPDSNADVLGLMRQLVERPVSSRLAGRKVERIEKLLASNLPEAIAGTNVENLGRHSDRLWSRLASAMGQAPDAKTITFAMKVFDLLHRVVTGRYTQAGEQAPIITDLRIARVSFSAGLLRAPLGLSVVDAVEQAEKLLRQKREPFLHAWEHVREQGRLNLFRVDSLLWQFAEPIYERRHACAPARHRIVKTLGDVGCAAPLAETVAYELTWALE